MPRPFITHPLITELTDYEVRPALCLVKDDFNPASLQERISPVNTFAFAEYDVRRMEPCRRLPQPFQHQMSPTQN
jgi:hypothetical protein